MQKKHTYIILLAIASVAFLTISNVASKQPIITLFSTKTATETFIVYKDESLPYTRSQEYIETEIIVDGYKTINIYWIFKGNPQQAFYLQLGFEVSDPTTGEKYREPYNSLIGPAQARAELLDFLLLNEL